MIRGIDAPDADHRKSFGDTLCLCARLKCAGSRYHAVHPGGCACL